jgi:hypothetical protein
VPTTADGRTEARSWGEECGEGPVTNHGQYVAGQPRNGAARSEAARSDCGKPLSSVGQHDDSEEPEKGETSPGSAGKVASLLGGPGKGKGTGLGH